MSYYVDLTTISLEEFFAKIQAVSVLPSQKILAAAPEESYRRLKNAGICQLHELQAEVKTKDKLKAFAQKTGLTEEYLTLMRRELDRYHPKPISFRDIPGLTNEVLEKLRRNNIHNTLQLFDRVIMAGDREELAGQLGIAPDSVLELTKLADVSRIMYTTPSFARLLIAAQYDSAQKIAAADPGELYRKLAALNNAQAYTKARFREKDMQLFIRYAQDVPPVILW